jgi:DNA-3-methyladenine glycosylase I
MPAPKNGLITDEKGVSRCWWHGNDPEYLRYHDQEWGYPVKDDIRLFEKICLEGFQAGLSWLTILRKRENFRNAFDNFDYTKVAKYNDKKVEKLLKDKGIIRHRGKIESTINNAMAVQDIIAEFGSFAAYAWQYEPDPKTRPKNLTFKILSAMGKTPESIAMSKDLKKRGWSFVGPTTCYAFMQSMGMVNDHIEGCCCREKSEDRRARFKRPQIRNR